MRGTVALTIVSALWLSNAAAFAQDGQDLEDAAAAAADTAGEAEAAAGEAADEAVGEAAAAADEAAQVTEGVMSSTEAAAAPSAPIDAGTYSVRLRDLEQRISELKEQIFRSKARLSLLAETVLEGVVGGAQSVIVHQNRMSRSFKLVRAVYALDGAPIFNKADEEGGLGDQEEFEVYNGSIVPGEHTLTVNLEYRGHGFGVFSYLKGYRFRVRSTYTFIVPEGRIATINVVGYEKGGPTSPLEERPAVRYIERVERRARPATKGEDRPQ